METRGSVANAAEDTKETSGWVLVNAHVFIGLVGATACFAWLFLSLGTTSFIVSISEEGFPPVVGLFCFVIGVAISLLASWFFSDWLSSHKITHFGISLCFSLAGNIGLWFVQGQVLYSYGFSLIFGCGFGLLYPLYGEFISSFFYGYIRPYVYGLFTCSALLCGGLLFTGVQFSFFFASVFPAISFLAYAFVLFHFKLYNRPLIKKRDSDSRQRIVWRSYLATATSGMALGYGIGCMMSVKTIQPLSNLVTIILVLCVCIILFTDSMKKRKITETLTMRLFLPLSAVIVFPLMFVPDEWKYLFAVLLVCGSLFPTTCSISAIITHISICKLSEIRAFSLGRLMCFLGIGGGFLLAYLGFSSVIRDQYGALASIGSVVLLMLLMIFSASFVMTEDNYPERSRFRVDPSEEEPVMLVSPGTPIRKVDSTNTRNKSEEADFDNEKGRHRGAFHVKCEVIAERYGLSKRQREVLGYLAKGRNADFITEKLVISSHTAKAHIYNVYQKTGVHSRQELMDLVESVEIDSEEQNK